MITMTIFLMLVFNLKHFVADYPLQTPFMLGKFKEDKSFVTPLAAHCGVHAVFTFTLSYLFMQNATIAFNLAVFDFTVHFIMDRIKAAPVFLGRFQALSKAEMMKTLAEAKCPLTKQVAQDKLRSNKMFWWSLGFDQMVHHATDILIVYVIAHTMVYGS